MKIGIITFHRAHNYGAVLQCYALQRVLELFGNKVNVIDYRQSYIEANYAIFSWRKLKLVLNSLRNVVFYFEEIPKRIKRKKLFESFVTEKLNLTYPCGQDNIPDDFQIYMIGSDQLWSINLVRGVDPIYWGDFKVNTRSIKTTYAISANIDSLKTIEKKQLCSLLNNFSSLSVREESISKTIHEITGRSSRVDVDPVLLTDIDDWDSLINTKWEELDYILIYQIHYPQGNSHLLKNRAKQLFGKSIRIIDLTPKLFSPSDFVSLLKYAKFVLTTSFHGTAFSVLFNKPFYTFHVNERVDARSKQLLDSLGLEGRFVSVDQELCNLDINYAEVNIKLKEIRSHSLMYLKELSDENFSRR